MNRFPPDRFDPVVAGIVALLFTLCVTLLLWGPR